MPPALIAQTPADRRDASRLFVLHRDGQDAEHRHFYDLPSFLNPGDCLVLNDTKVLPARLMGHLGESRVEILLLREESPNVWHCLARPAKKLKTGVTLTFGDGALIGQIEGAKPDGSRLIRFTFDGNFDDILQKLGEMPLPPYIHQKPADPGRYQTVYAREQGSAAAPTAGLHFTPALLSTLKERGIKTIFVTLHVGIGTFRPVRAENIADHVMHEEWFSVSAHAADVINHTRVQRTGRIVAVGTTVCRTLEAASGEDGQIKAGCGQTDIFITPGYRFRAVDALITNFHLPESTLLMLVSAFAGKENTFTAYAQAIAREYRFFSFGDAMLIL